MKRFALGLVAASLGIALVAEARPVRVGRFVEIPYGISSSHPWRTGGGDPMRTARSSVAAPSQPPNQQWVTETGTGRSHAPAIDESGMIYVAGQRGLSAVGPDGTAYVLARGGLDWMEPTSDLSATVTPAPSDSFLPSSWRPSKKK